MSELLQPLQALALIVIGTVGPPLLGIILLVWGGSLILRIVVRVATAGARRSRVKPAIIDLLRAAIVGTGWILIFAGVMQILHMDQIAFALGGSISLVALGIATAASGNLGDIIAGIFLASDPDFGTGFTITTDKLTGTIEHIDLRKTRIRASDGKLHVVPNKMIETAIWIVEGRPNEPSPQPLFHRPGRHLTPTPPSSNPSAPPATAPQ